MERMDTVSEAIQKKLDEAKELKTRLDAFRACWSWLESWVDSNAEEEEKK